MDFGSSNVFVTHMYTQHIQLWLLFSVNEGNKTESIKFVPKSYLLPEMDKQSFLFHAGCYCKMLESNLFISFSFSFISCKNIFCSGNRVFEPSN